MRFRQIAILAGVVGLIIIYLVFFSERVQRLGEGSLFRFDRDDVSAISLTGSSGTIVMKRTKQGWWIERPLEFGADQGEVRSLLSVIESLKSSRDLGDVSDKLGEYGLDEPDVKAELSIQKNGEIRKIGIGFGDETPNGMSVYAQALGEKSAILLPAGKKESLDRRLFDLRDKQIADFEEEDVVRLAIRTRTREFVVSREEKTWRLEKPIEGKADEDATGDLLFRLKSLRATNFIDDPEKPRTYGLHRPVAVFEIGEADRVLKLEIGRGKDEREAVYARLTSGDPVREGWVYRLDTDLLDKLPDRPFDLRDKHLARFEASAIGRMEIRYGKDAVVDLSRSSADDEWSLDKPSAKKLKAGAAEDRLWEALAIRATDLVGEGRAGRRKYGLDKPNPEVILYDLSGKELVRLLFGDDSEKDEGIYVTRESDTKIYTVEALVRDFFPRTYDSMVFEITEQPEIKAPEGGAGN